MLSKELTEKHSEQYAPLIKWIIESNQIDLNIDERIQYRLVWDDNLSITAAVNRETNLLTVNLAFVDEEYRNNRIYNIEYFILHEMRHIYQHIQIKKYKTKENEVGPSFIEKWIEEGKNYVTALDKEGNENPDYPKQDCEFDAYAFSFAVMHHKYSGRYDGSLYVPPIYKSELKEKYDSAVKEFVDFLK